LSLKIKLPRIVDTSKPELESFKQLSKHPLLDGELIEDITLSTTTKYTRVPHGLKRRYRGFLDIRGVGLVEDQGCSKKNKEIWLYRESAPVLLDYHEVETANSQITFSNLEGNNDIAYRIVMEVNNADAGDITLEPNGLTTNQTYDRASITGAAISHATGSTLLLSDTTGNKFIDAYFFAKEGENRYLQSFCTRGSNANTDMCFSAWTDGDTEVTSLDIVHAGTNGFAVGTQVWLYAMESRATKASIWIF
jgi:hypothetical protein